jgi:hypothetical protein
MIRNEAHLCAIEKRVKEDKERRVRTAQVVSIRGLLKSRLNTGRNMESVRIGKSKNSWLRAKSVA